MEKEPREKQLYEVLYEEIRSMVQLVLEGHSMLDRKIEALRQNMQGVQGELTDIGKAVTESGKLLGTLISRFEAHEHAHTN